MIVSGYDIGEKIHESARSVVYRARRRSDGARVILKTLVNEHPRPNELARVRREFEIGNGLAIEGVVAHHALDRFMSRLAIVTEDFGAEELRSFARRTKLDLGEILDTMAQVAGALGAIHQRGIVHKDVNPSNIVIHPETRQVKLIDFGIATALSRESAAPRNLDQLEGTLGYISPEQTGRVNRAIDYRTDFYSLGATFYELLTGEVPFAAKSAVEMIHAHLAREPVPPHERRPEVPEVVSRIVLKLLSKAAEDRYQTGHGLQADLEECRGRWRATSQVAAFALGAHDVSDRLQIPQRLYGREAEIGALLATFERASAGRAELMLVAGYSGIGKTALVSEVHKPIVEKRGYFISGKFDQLQRDIPYNSLIQAFSALVRQLLAEPEPRLRAFREKLEEALGQSGRVITDVIPEVELIIGRPPPIQELPPPEAQNRFNFVFRAFVHAFAAEPHPLVIFLDDLQWADAPSLKLLSLLLTDPSTRHLLVMGAYRDNEVESAHPLMVTLDGIRKEGGAVSTLQLAPLDLGHVNQLVSETLRCSPEESLSLATLSLQKTDGNPFFLGQFLRSLAEEKLLALDPARRAWRWDADEIRRRGITDNVVELMAGKIRKLSERSQHVVKLAACIGNLFDLATLSIVDERSHVETARGVWEALREGLLLPVDEAYQLAEPSMFADEAADVPHVSYRFLHDRVQQAAYSLISEDSRAAVHLKVGRLLLASTPAAEIDARIFDIVHHLNLGKEGIAEGSERYDLARWNLVAGRKANASAAHEPALRYFTTGLGLLPPEAFDERYELTFDLHLEAIEAEHVNGHFERAQELSDVALARSRTLLERVRILEIRILFHTARVEYAETIRIARQALEMLGVVLPPPETVTPAHIGDALGATATLLAGRRAGDLMSLRHMTDPEKLAAVRVLTILAAPTYIATPSSFPLVVCKLVQLSLEHGNSRFSPYCYVIYGVVLAGVLGEVDAANEFGDLALVLLDDFGAKELRAKVYTLLCLFLRHWKMHERVGKELGREAVHAALEVGDLEYVGYGADDFVLHSLYLGDPLDEVVREGRAYFEMLTRLKQEFQRVYLAVAVQMALALQGRTGDPSRIHGDVFDEDTSLPELLAVNNTTTLCLFYVSSAMLAYTFGDHARTADLAAKAEPYLNGMLGKVTVVQQNFYQSLALLGLCETASPDDRLAHLARVDANQEQMTRWALHGQANFGHKHKLVAAERLRAAGQIVEAMAAFDEAIDGAAQNGFVNEEALACERAAALYFALGRERVAASYLAEARYAYVRWGATAKVAAIDAAHPSLVARQPRAALTDSLFTTTTTTGGVAIDLVTVMKAAQTISAEIVLDRLLEALMRSVLESAGAQRALLIVERDDALVIEVERSSLGASAVSRRAPVDGDTGLSAAIVHYVERTRESLVLRDAGNEGLFTADPYVLRCHPRSIPCAPLLNQGKLTAILYLENNLTAGAFTEDRIEVLRILSAQAALSIHNARLYANLEGASARLAEYSRTLEHKVEARTTELRDMNEELGTTLTQLRATQQQLVTQEKLASLGALTAGIAHEIRNPLNFINNFAALSADLFTELGDLLRPLAPQIGADTLESVDHILDDLRHNVLKIAEHGTRADAIVHGMLMHSREMSGPRAEGDLNAILAESVSLTYHGMKAREPEYDLQILTEYDEALGTVELVATEMSRVFVNVINNACYATREKKRALGAGFSPMLTVRTKSFGDRVEVRLRDNGAGIPEDVVDRIFHPFFTTKPPGEGTGLGLSISHEIVVQGHQGEIRVDTELGEFTELTITLPRKFGPPSGARSSRGIGPAGSDPSAPGVPSR